MNNEKAFSAYLQEKGIASGFIHKRFDSLNPKTMGIYTRVVAHKTTEIRSPIVGLLQNRIGKEEQPEVPKTN